MVEQIVAGVTCEAALGKYDEVDAAILCLLHESEGAVGVEGAVREPEFRTGGRDTKKAVSVHMVLAKVVPRTDASELLQLIIVVVRKTSHPYSIADRELERVASVESVFYEF